jgi:predicted CoA-binding protein
MSDRQGRLIETADGIAELLRGVKTVAVLGIKTEAQADQPAHYVPAYCQRAGLEVIPVPVYYPDAKAILGRPVYRSVAAVEGEVDLVNVFRRPADVDQHVDDIIQKRPRAVWLQSGIRNDAAAARLTSAGIDVVQDRCLMVELRRLGR